MLVLRRKAGEAIVLNGVITIYVLAVEGERVKLGISAPPEVVIVRSELLDTPGGGPTPMPGRPTPPIEPASEFPRGPRPPERPYREPQSPFHEPEGPRRTRDDDPTASDFGELEVRSAPARYTPRRRFDHYGENSNGHDPTGYR